MSLLTSNSNEFWTKSQYAGRFIIPDFDWGKTLRISLCFKVDYLIDDHSRLSAAPIEVKSGKDYTIHSALNVFVKNEDYHVKKAYTSISSA